MDASFTHSVRPRFNDLDGMGHVNHAVYLTYLEEARVAFFERVFGGLDRDRPFSFFLVRAEIDYRRPARLGDVLTTRLRLTRFGRASFDFEYVLEDAAGNRMAEARTVQACVDRDGRSTPVPEEFRRAVEDFQGSARSPGAPSAPPASP